MRRLRRRRPAGFTLLEVVMSISLTATVLLAAGSIAGVSIGSSSGIGTAAGLSVRVCESADKLARTLQSAGLLGEDANGNGAMDAGEDTNRNGRLDSDWSLADGASASTLTFNVMSPTYYWSSPITFSVVNGVLLKTQDGVSVDICHNVSALTFSRNGDLIDILLTLTANDRTGRSWTASAERRVNVRN